MTPPARAPGAPPSPRVGGRDGPVLVVAASARAIVGSAARGGFACAAADRFGDLDLRAAVPDRLRATVGPRTSPGRLVRAAEGLPGRAAVYGAPFENHPGAVATLSAAREVWGNPPAVLRRVRDPFLLADALRDGGVPTPAVLAPGEEGGADPGLRWLRKRRRSGGGAGVTPWRPGDPLRPGEVLQERREGVAGSAVAVADGRRAAVLGLTRQLLGVAAFGVRGFRYCGSILPLTDDAAGLERAVAAARRAADVLASAFALRGAFGFDFIMAGGRLHVLEVNPRFTASMELVERALGTSVFALHVLAAAGDLFRTVPEAAPGVALGKAVLFARRPVVVGDTRSWLRLPLADVPPPGTVIPAGGPVCTLFAEASGPARCRIALEDRARALRRSLSREAGRRPRAGGLAGSRREEVA